jgi:hypothetical protein
MPHSKSYPSPDLVSKPAGAIFEHTARKPPWFRAKHALDYGLGPDKIVLGGPAWTTLWTYGYGVT